MNTQPREEKVLLSIKHSRFDGIFCEVVETETKRGPMVQFRVGRRFSWDGKVGTSHLFALSQLDAVSELVGALREHYQPVSPKTSVAVHPSILEHSPPSRPERQVIPSSEKASSQPLNDDDDIPF
jgi:hypothetical protein